MHNKLKTQFDSVTVNIFKMNLTGTMLLFTLLCSGGVVCSIIPMKSVCEVKLNVLLDCTQVQMDEGAKYVFQNKKHDITRIEFFRLHGTLSLENLPEVNIIEAMAGNTGCHQIISNKKVVTLVLSDRELTCRPKDEQELLGQSTEIKNKYSPITSTILSIIDLNVELSSTDPPSTIPSINILPTANDNTDDVNAPPIITVPPVAEIEVELGGTFTIICEAGGEPTPQIWWHLNWVKIRTGDRVTTVSEDGRGVLTVRDARYSDAGAYTCEAINNRGSIFAIPDALVIVRRADWAPTVRIEPRYQEVDEGTPVRFNCIATGEPTPRIEWYRGGNREMNPDATVTSDGVFRIPRVRQDDESDYYCKATNDLGTTEIRTILYVTRVDRPEITIIVRQTKYVTIVGETARLECYAEDASGRVTLFWSRATGLPSGSSQAKGILTIPDVQPSYAGNYVCTGTETETGRVSTAIAVLEVQIQEETVVPTVKMESETVTIPMGTTGTLRCKVTGKPEPKITWLKSRKELAPNHQVNGNVLRITQATMADRGIYVCRAENAVGLDQDWTAVEVERRMRPKIDLYPNTTQRVYVGSSALFQCRVMDGDPPPTVTWSRVGGVPMPADKVETMENGVIMFKQVTKAEQGGYICAAENEMGTTTTTATLIVEGRMRPKIGLYPNTTQRVYVGSSALFLCRVMDGDPPPTVTWSRVGGAPMPADKVETMENGVIMFKQVTKAEQGGYICAAENEMGTTTATATLIVEGPPTITIQPSKTVYALIGQRVTLECTADGDPLPVVYWIEPVRRGRGVVPLEGDRDLEEEVTCGTAIVDIANVERIDQGTYTCVASNTGGRTEDRVQLVVQEGETRGVSISGPSTLSVVEGQSVELICSATELRGSVIRWRRREGVLPTGHSVRNGVLTLPRFGAEYSGEYICSTTVQQQSYEASVFINIAVAPRLTISPKLITSRAGDTIQLRCTASGGGPFTIEWSRNGALMNPSATERDGILEIRQVTAADAGRYRCVVQSSSGTNDGYALVEIEVPPSVIVEQRDVYTEVNRIARLRCDASGSPIPLVRWEKEGDQLPAQHKIQDGVLTIYVVREEDAGRYICTASSSSGSSRDYAVLHVTTDSDIDNRGENVDTKMVNVGDRVSMECIATGTPLPTITWSRDDGPLPKDVILGDGILIIPQARIEDAGTFTCLAVNEAGSISSKVVLYVRVPPSVIVEQRDVYTEVNRIARLRCDASGSPIPLVRWEKEGDQLPAQHNIQDGVLTIYGVREEDAGRYICTASSSSGSSRDYAVLHVTTDSDIDNRGKNVDTQVVNVGDRVSMECIVTGTPLPTITWSRDDGPLPKDVILGDGILIIPQARIEDAGSYTCLAVNVAGSISSKVVLYVRAINLDTQFEFAGDGFMMLPKGLLPHNKTQEKQTISFDITTTQQDGLILWQGGAGGKRLRGGDHISIGLKGGYIEFSYEMGSGPATIMSRKPVDDGLTHSVSVERIGRSGNLKVDNEDTVYGDSQGYLQMLNADGNIYLGGVSLPEIMTDGMFTNNFIGCIYSVKIRDKGPLKTGDAIEGYNVQACSP